MILNSTTEIIRLRLDGTVTTNQLQWVTGHNDITTSTFVAGSTDGDSNNTTNVTIVASPAASTQRQVTSINVYNPDTTNSVVTIEKFNGSNARVLCQCLLAPGDTLYWSREAGWKVIKGTNTDSSYILREYISGTTTWNKPAGIKAAMFLAVGAGGGGGGGARNATSTNRFGGGGGGGGAVVWYYLNGASIGSSYTVTVGAGGTAGAAATVDNTPGGAGGIGGDTSIGSIVIAKGGNGGGGGSASAGTAGAGGATGNCSPAFGPYSIGGANGVAGGTTGNTSSAVGLNGTNAAPGGNGGRGISNTNTFGGTFTVAGIYSNGGIVGVTTVLGANGTNDLSQSLFFNNGINGLYGMGTGGNGGDSSNTGGFAGGNGGRCAGGGGGGATLNGFNSGAGGTGGGGLAKILEIY